MFQLFQIFWKILIFSKKHRPWSQKWLIKSKISIWWETLFCDFYFFEFRWVIVKKNSGKKFIGELLRMTCHASVCGRPHPADTNIGRERHKIQNFEKNGTYVKYNGLLRMPTKKPKKAIFDNESSGHQYAHGILLYLGPDIVPGNFLCMDN